MQQHTKVENYFGDWLKTQEPISGKIENTIKTIIALPINHKIIDLIRAEPRTIDFFSYNPQTKIFSAYEVKSGKNELRPPQKKMLKKLMELGVRGYLYYQYDLRTKSCLLPLNKYDFTKTNILSEIREELYARLGDQWSYKRDFALKNNRNFDTALDELYIAVQELENAERKANQKANLALFYLNIVNESGSPVA